jgi:hypothetical protein
MPILANYKALKKIIILIYNKIRFYFYFLSSIITSFINGNQNHSLLLIE